MSWNSQLSRYFFNPMYEQLNMCRVCGYNYKNYFPWGENGNSPTYDFCDCCGVEFGYGDYTIIAIKNWRQKWIRNGMIWDRAKDEKSILYQSPPKDYNPTEQLKSLPPEWQ